MKESNKFLRLVFLKFLIQDTSSWPERVIFSFLKTLESKSRDVVGTTEENDTILAERDDRTLDETLRAGTRAIRDFNVCEYDDTDGDKEACLNPRDLVLRCESDGETDAVKEVAVAAISK